MLRYSTFPHGSEGIIEMKVFSLKLRYSTFPHGSESDENGVSIKVALRYSTFPHGSERSSSVCVVANSFDDYIK